MKHITVHVCRAGQLRDLCPKTKMLMDTIEEIAAQYKDFDVYYEHYLHHNLMSFSADISIVKVKGVVGFTFPDIDEPFTFDNSAIQILENRIFHTYRRARI